MIGGGGGNNWLKLSRKQICIGTFFLLLIFNQDVTLVFNQSQASERACEHSVYMFNDNEIVFTLSMVVWNSIELDQVGLKVAIGTNDNLV